ncbi:late embryogenesis abundant protein 3-like [Silene latifolia]|uniref:late embryogenesis abundant protein 3-like n=1 Tax=Silene latifolia TaxID=37657 RepID=UPI003D788178
MAEKLTIGTALEVAATVIGDKPVNESDAAAIQAAEMRATGTTAPPPTGVGIEAQAAAMANNRRIYDDDMTTLAEVIGNAREKLEADKEVTQRDAEKVRAAELQGDVEGIIGGHLLRDFPKESLTPGGVAEVVATAATLNQPSST